MTKYIITSLLVGMVVLFAYIKVQEHKIDNMQQKIDMIPTEVFEKVQDERKHNYEETIDNNGTLDGNTTYRVRFIEEDSALY